MQKTVTSTAASDAQNREKFNSKEYRRSANGYTFECMFEYFISILVSGQFLTVLLKYIGVPDSLNGVIQSIISLAFLFQIFSVFVLHKISNTKRFAVLFHTTSQLFFVTLFLIPFFPIADNVKHILAVICPLVAYFGNYFVTSVIYRWGNSFVEPHHRGRFCARKEMISLMSGMVLTLAMGYAIDSFEASDNLRGGFILLALSILVFCISDFVCLMIIKNDKKPRDERAKAHESLPLRDIMKNTLGNKSFRSTVVVATLWRAGVFFTYGFMGTYMDNSHELNFSVGTVQLITLFALFVRFLVAIPIGKYADKTSYARAMRVGLCIASCAFLVNIFTTPSDFARYLVIPYLVLYNASLSCIDSNLLNLPYSYVDEKYFIHASAIKNSISGLGGFLASLLAGALLGYIQGNGNTLFGFHVYGQQVLSVISFIIMMISVFYTKFVIEKQKIMIQ